MATIEFSLTNSLCLRWLGQDVRQQGTATAGGGGAVHGEKAQENTPLTTNGVSGVHSGRGGSGSRRCVSARATSAGRGAEGVAGLDQVLRKRETEEVGGAGRLPDTLHVTLAQTYNELLGAHLEGVSAAIFCSRSSHTCVTPWQGFGTWTWLGRTRSSRSTQIPNTPS